MNHQPCSEHSYIGFHLKEETGEWLQRPHVFGKIHRLQANTSLPRPLLSLVLLFAGLLAVPLIGQSANDGFDPNPNGPVYGIALETNGDIIIGGTFTSVGGAAHNRIANVKSFGLVDPTFTTDASGYRFGYTTVYSLAVQHDGKILVGGDFTTLAGDLHTNIGRLLINGLPDTDFNAWANSRVSSRVVQSDNKILVAGWFYGLNNWARPNIGRLKPDGSSDITFFPVPNFPFPTSFIQISVITA